MRVLIDECVDPRVTLLLGDHKVATVHEQRWDALEDGPLLAVAQEEFDVLVTIDGNLEFQQNLSKFKIGIVVVHVAKKPIRSLSRHAKGHTRRYREGSSRRSVSRQNAALLTAPSPTYISRE